MEETNIEEKNGNVPEKLTRRHDVNYTSDVNDGIDAPKWKLWKRRRYILTAMTFLGFFNMLALRSNVSVAVTAMTTKRTVDLENGTSVEEPEFKWDTKMQGLVLGSYFYGYITTQIFGGWLGARIGGNVLFGAGIAGISALTLLTPTLVKMNVYCFVGLRVLEGACEGISFPSIQDVWAHWIPRQERNRLATISYSGRYIGTFVCMTVSGILAEHLGWPYVFYLFGFLGLLWYSMWLLLIKRRPEDDKSIYPSELHYIRKNIEETERHEEAIRYPWKTFLLSGPVWAITVANVTDNWGAFTLLTQLPTFLKDSLEFDVQDAGILSSLPYLAVAFTMQISGLCADYILAKKYLTTTQMRKLFCCSAFLCQAILMLLTAFFQTPAAAVTFLTLSVGFGAFATAAYTMNQLDLSPQHASVLLGISNTFGTVPGIISPTITGYLVPNRTNSEWQIVFFVTSVIYFAGAMFYGLFVSGEIQSWSQDNIDQKKSSKNHKDSITVVCSDSADKT